MKPSQKNALLHFIIEKTWHSVYICCQRTFYPCYHDQFMQTIEAMEKGDTKVKSHNLILQYLDEDGVLAFYNYQKKQSILQILFEKKLKIHLYFDQWQNPITPHSQKLLYNL